MKENASKLHPPPHYHSVAFSPMPLWGRGPRCFFALVCCCASIVSLRGGDPVSAGCISSPALYSGGGIQTLKASSRHSFPSKHHECYIAFSLAQTLILLYPSASKMLVLSGSTNVCLLFTIYTHICIFVTEGISRTHCSQIIVISIQSGNSSGCRCSVFMEHKPALRLRKAERAYPYILKLPSFMLVLGIKDRIVNSNCSTATPRVSVYTWVGVFYSPAKSFHILPIFYFFFNCKYQLCS